MAVAKAMGGGRDAPPAPCNSVPDSLWFVPGFVPMGDFSEVLERLERYKISEKTKGPEGPCVVLAERESVSIPSSIVYRNIFSSLSINYLRSFTI